MGRAAGRGARATTSAIDPFAATLGSGRGPDAAARARTAQVVAAARGQMPKLLLAFGQSESVSGSVSQALGRAFTELEAGADPRPESQLICVRRSAGDTIDELSVSLTELIDEMKAPGFFGALWLALGEDYDSYDSDPRYELSSSDPAGVARQLAAVFAEDSESLLNAHFLLANS